MINEELKKEYDKLEDLESDYEIIKAMSGDEIEMMMARKRVVNQLNKIRRMEDSSKDGLNQK